MPLIALGINHRTASLDVRERVAFAPDQMLVSLQQGRETSGADDLAILSTCNRTEIYATGSIHHTALLAWLVDHHQLPSNALDTSYYVLEDEKAVQHMMKVASGLDSMVLGEPQILGQMKSSYAVAQKAGTADGLLAQVFRVCLSLLSVCVVKRRLVKTRCRLPMRQSAWRNVFSAQ